MEGHVDSHVTLTEALLLNDSPCCDTRPCCIKHLTCKMVITFRTKYLSALHQEDE